MEGTLGQDITDTDALTARAHKELVKLRGSTGRLTVQKFGQYSVLREICGGGDLLDAFLMFEREMRRYRETAGRNEIAAVISITAPANTVLDRLENAAVQLPQEDGEIRDQRTARRWSDAGLRLIAADLVYMAQVQGRLGQELLNIEVHGNEKIGLQLVIDQMTTKGLTERAPLIRAWHYPKSDDEPEEHAVTVDMEQHTSAAVENEIHRMERYRVHAALPLERVSLDEEVTKILSISIEGRDAPMRTVMIQDKSEFLDGHRTQSTVFRTIVMFEVIRVTNLR